MDEKEPLHTSFPSPDSVQVGERGRIRWPLYVSVLICLPLIAALALYAAMSFPSEAMLMGPLKLIQIEGTDAGLWLGYSGACGSSKGDPVFCDLSFLQAYYNKVYDKINLDALQASVPDNLGYESTLLFAGLVAQALGVIFVVWGAVDYYRAEEWHYSNMRGWVAEWIISRRLDLMGSAFVIGGIVAVATCAASTSIKLATAASAVNTLASATASDYSGAETGKGTLALFGACIMSAAAIVIELLVLAFDGLGHRIRRDYEDLVDDVQQLENESWVALEAKMHTLQQLAVRHTKADSMPDTERRERAKQTLVEYLKASEIDSLLNQMQDVVNKHRIEVSQIRAQAQMLAPQTITAPQVPVDPRNAPPVGAGVLANMLDRLDNRERQPKRAASLAQGTAVQFSQSPPSTYNETPPRLAPINQTMPQRAPHADSRPAQPVQMQPSVDNVAAARKQAYLANAAAAESDLGDRDMPQGFFAGPRNRPPAAGRLGGDPDPNDPLSMPPTSGKGNKRFVATWGHAL